MPKHLKYIESYPLQIRFSAKSGYIDRFLSSSQVADIDMRSSACLGEPLRKRLRENYRCVDVDGTDNVATLSKALMEDIVSSIDSRNDVEAFRENLKRIAGKHRAILRTLLRFKSQKFTDVDDKSFSVLADFISANIPHITGLSLVNFINITDESIRFLSQTQLRIKSLDLSGCKKLTEECLKYLGDMLPYLERLILKDTSLADDKVERFFKKAADKVVLDELRVVMSSGTIYCVAPKSHRSVE